MRSFVTQTVSIPTNGIRLHAETAGPEDGPLVILLHGFPEMWSGWHNQIPALARSGCRVVAPDQRGYNLSDKPEGVEAYQLPLLARDITGLIDAVGREKAVIVGHDWGGVVAWYLAIHYPERVEKLAILNAPHPAAMTRALASPATGQLLRSWYIAFFQIPGLPEWLLSLGGYAVMRWLLRASAKPATFTPAELRRYTEGWSRRAASSQIPALTSMINWYRASLRGMIKRQAEGYLQDRQSRVTVPTLILWGEQDVALAPQLAPWSQAYCDQGELVRFPEATHWVQHDEAERVNNRLLDFILDEAVD